MIGTGILIGVGVAIFIGIICFTSWYKVVNPTEAHVVVSGWGKIVVSSDEKVSPNQRSYLAIPLFRKIRVLDVTVKDLDITHETYEKNQARYNVRASMKYRITQPLTAAETFTNDEELNTLLKGVLQAAVRAVTVKYDVTDARANKLDMEKEVITQIENDLKAWGITLVNFQLIDFQDTNESKIISNISRRREVEIESTTREVNAEKIKQAEVAEAVAKQTYVTRQIERDEAIAKREQDKNKTVAEQMKVAKDKEFDVIQVQTIRQAEITKEKAIVESEQKKQQAIILASQSRETEAIMKEQKLLEGQGNKLRAEEDALAVAAPIKQKMFAEAEGNKAVLFAQADGLRAKLMAEAEGKTKLQEALNKFEDKAIRALVAEQIVAMQKDVGVATANALSKADVRAFIGGQSGQSGFDLGQVISSLSVTNDGAAQAVLNKLARPNDLGLAGLKIEAGGEKSPAPKIPTITKNQFEGNAGRIPAKKGE